MPRRLPRLLPVAVAAALVLSACGGSGEDAATDSPSSAPAPSASPQAAESPSAAPSPEPSAAPSAAVSGADGEYVDDDGFAITFPEDWTVRPDVGGLQVAGVAPDQTDPSSSDTVGVLFEATGKADLTTKEYLDATAANAPKLIPGVEIIDRDDEQGLFEYRGTINDRELHFLARVVVDEEGGAYTASYTATEEGFAAGRPVAEKVLQSLRTD